MSKLVAYLKEAEESCKSGIARTSSLNPKILEEISAKLGLEFVVEKEFGKDDCKPLTPTLSRKGRGSCADFRNNNPISPAKRGFAPSPLAGEGWGEGSLKNPQNHRYYSPYIKNFARDLRKNSTDVEIKFWSRIRNNQLGCKFRRQFAVDSKYIADFACLKKRLIIELDGGQHYENPQDLVRTFYLEKENFRVIRFWNDEVLTNIEGCLDGLLEEINFGKKQF